MDMKDKIRLEFIHSPTTLQAKEISRLQKISFADVSEEEAENDFFHHEIVQVLAYFNDQLVGWAGVHITEQEYEYQNIKIGGYGICTHPDYQRKGVASMIVAEVIQYLHNNDCDIGFLSVNPNDQGSIMLHQKFGFVKLSKDFSWTDSKGKLKHETKS